MQIVVMYHGIYMSGKIKDVCRYLRENRQTCSTLKQFIKQRTQ